MIRYIARGLMGSLLFIFWMPGMVQADSEIHYDQVNFQASGSERIANDWMTVVLAAQGESHDAAILADRINQAMDWALKVAGDGAMVKVRTGNYQTYPTYDKRIVTGWRASQELILESRDFAAVGLLVGRLQEQLQVRSMAFSISPQARAEAEERLMVQALDQFKKRAKLVSGNLNGKGYRIVNLSINTSSPMPRPVSLMRTQAMAMESVAAPALEGGDTTVTVNVNGAIEVQK